MICRSGAMDRNAKCRSPTGPMDQQITTRGNIEGISRFSADSKDRGKWREYLRNRIVNLEPYPVGEDTLCVSVAMPLPGPGIGACNLSPVRCARTRGVMRDGNDNPRLVTLRQAASSAPADHLGRELTVEPGSGV